MPRKNIPKKSAVNNPPAKTVSQIVKSKRSYRKPIHQCQACGGLVESIYVNRGSAWCPHCRTVDLIMTGDGVIPFPEIYGVWVEEQEEKQRQKLRLKEWQRQEQEREARLLRASNNQSITSKLHAGNKTFSAVNPSTPSIQPTPRGELTMKTPQTHNGIYSCHECCIEYELSGEASLKCDKCGCMLLKGELEDLDDEDDDEDYP